MFGRKSATAAVEEPERISLEEAARLTLQKSEANLASCRGRLDDFLKQHTRVVDGRNVFLAGSITARAELDREARSLVTEYDRAFANFQSALSEWSSLK
jgi:hypothetical protein